MIHIQNNKSGFQGPQELCSMQLIPYCGVGYMTIIYYVKYIHRINWFMEPSAGYKAELNHHHWEKYSALWIRYCSN